MIVTSNKAFEHWGEIFVDDVEYYYKLLKAQNPDVRIFMWSDMLDPAHNARDNYYGVVGDFTDSWKHVPKELIMMCW